MKSKSVGVEVFARLGYDTSLYVMIGILPYIQVGLSILLITGILLQRSEESLGAAFGSEGAGGGRFLRRGFEKFLFNATLTVAALFVLVNFLGLLLAR